MPIDRVKVYVYFHGMRKENAISHFGSQQKLADALGIKQGSVSGWGELVPLGRAFVLERLTNGALKVDLGAYEALKRQPAQ